MTQGQIAAALMRIESQLLLARAACVDGIDVEVPLLAAREALNALEALAREVFVCEPPTAEYFLATGVAVPEASTIYAGAGTSAGPLSDATDNERCPCIHPSGDRCRRVVGHDDAHVTYGQQSWTASADATGEP